MKTDRNGLVRCRVCGCTEVDACAGGCAWVDADLCSTCNDAVLALMTWNEDVRQSNVSGLLREFRSRLKRPAEKPALPSGLTSSQAKVYSFLNEHLGQWFRPSQIAREEYEGAASSIGRVLGGLKGRGLVESRMGDRGNGTVCTEWRARVFETKVAKGGVR